MDENAFTLEDSSGELVNADGRLAFDPDPLPPDLDATHDLLDANGRAMYALGRLADLERTVDTPRIIARKGAVDWQQVLDEVERQEEQTGQYFSFAVLDTLDLLADRYGIEAPIRSRLASYCLENALLLTLEEPKTIEDLREGLDFPDHQIYNKLRKLENEGAIDVDRSGTLNTYQAVTG